MSLNALQRMCLLFLPAAMALTVFNSKTAMAKTPAASVAQVVQATHAAGHFDGVVLVSQRGKILYAQGFGPANRSANYPNTLETPYRICSITKQFTALLVMQMVQQGKLRLDSPVTAYLPDFRADTGGKITLRNLLTHTSGLASVDDALPEKEGFPGFYQQTDPKFADAAYVTRTYLQGDLKTVPGEKFNYNNSDYIVLQAILEKTSGLPYAQLLQTRILKPLGMTHTGLIGKDAYAPRQAVGYIHDGAKEVAEPYIHLANFGAAGAMYSTARDLLRWNNALDNDILLAKPYRETMFTADKSLGYVALGSWVYPAAIAGAAKKPVLVERQGEIGAFHTLNLRAPEDGYSIVVLSNTDTADLSATYLQKGLAYDILKALYAPVTRTIGGAL